MKINYLQISNIMSFKHHADITKAPKITFDNDLNIIIGQNGAGKSTALEVITFIFKKIIFQPYGIQRDILTNKANIPSSSWNQIIHPHNHSENTHSFRLEPNWNTENDEQKILVNITLDDIDKSNLKLLEDNKQKLEEISRKYSTIGSLDFAYTSESFLVEVTLNPQAKTFIYSSNPDNAAFRYLVKYDFYRQLIEMHNSDNPKDQIRNLQTSFTLISGYRNYHSFTPSVSLSNEAPRQIQDIKINEVNRNTNSNEQSEPPIFNLVRLLIAQKHFDIVFTKNDEDEATQLANQEDFLTLINSKLALINLKVEIRLLNKNTWEYSFNFYDTKRNQILNDINSLSAGQKAIIHLIFEAYGRGELKGGVIIIDEPEIHLHYQFQYEYLKIIEKLNEEQKCQYILVTHSEALISSKTIDKVKRFSLDENNYTIVKSPVIKSDQKTLIKILDNTKSTYAFFSKKVVLVEGDSDRYFFKAILQEMKPELNQEVSIIEIGGKGNYKKWKDFFEAFGLKVYYIGDFDNIFSLKMPDSTVLSPIEKATIDEQLKQRKLDNLTPIEKQKLYDSYHALIADTDFLTKPKRAFWKPLLDLYLKLSKILSSEVVSEIRTQVSDIDAKIDAQYANNIYILKKGTLESYTETSTKDLKEVIAFCENIKTWLSHANEKVDEIKHIINQISR